MSRKPAAGYTSTMEKRGVLNFKVGQLAEMRTFEDGFRGAWFGCKIKDIRPKMNEILLEYYDFVEEDPSWVKIYQLPPYARRSKHIKRQLMVRPKYPAIYYKSEMPPVNSILQQACIVIDGSWKVGDMVDWFKDDCYWSGRIVKILSDDKVQVELPMPPSGEGKEGEEGRHEAFCKDLRPFLDWSETEGWSLPTMEGQTSCDAHLIFPTNQGMDLEVEHTAAAASPVNPSSTTRISTEGEGDRDSEQNVKTDGDLMESSENVKTDLEVEHAAAAAAASPVNASSTTRISAEGEEEGYRDGEQNVKTDGDLMESSESSSSLHVKKRKADAEDEEIEKINLNVAREHTLEAALLDLEELINKVIWMQRLLQSPTNDATTSSWKFA